MEAARIHAENAIRQKHQSINFLRMSARVDAVASRVQTAVTMNQVSKSMSGVVKSMDATLKSMNLEKISALMDKFEKQFETLDVQTAQMEDTMSSTTTLTTPQNEVDMLLHEMADEAGLDLNLELPAGQTSSLASSVASAEQLSPSADFSLVFRAVIRMSSPRGCPGCETRCHSDTARKTTRRSKNTEGPIKTKSAMCLQASCPPLYSFFFSFEKSLKAENDVFIRKQAFSPASAYSYYLSLSWLCCMCI
ncbi:charged multivesicular body protein 1b-1-like isoform X2 [Astatotilapia calliptera]|nr:charged multivesicular body protein 1b-1-like isoform X2 [Astatotilapia calliptera]